MRKTINAAFTVYHAAVGNRLLPEHVNYTTENCPSNVLDVEDSSDRHRTSFKKLIQMFSREDDWILDINSTEGMYAINNCPTVCVKKYFELTKFMHLLEISHLLLSFGCLVELPLLLIMTTINILYND
jgi:hypothetical protein